MTLMQMERKAKKSKSKKKDTSESESESVFSSDLEVGRGTTSVGSLHGGRERESG